MGVVGLTCTCVGFSSLHIHIFVHVSCNCSLCEFLAGLMVLLAVDNVHVEECQHWSIIVSHVYTCSDVASSVGSPPASC